MKFKLLMAGIIAGVMTLAPLSLATPAQAAPTGIFVVNHPKDPTVCGDGYKWVKTYAKAKHNKPRIMTMRLFKKGNRNFCLIVAREGKATGAKGPMLAALGNDKETKITHGKYAFYAMRKLKGSPCVDIIGVVKYGKQQAERTTWACGR